MDISQNVDIRVITKQKKSIPQCMESTLWTARANFLPKKSEWKATTVMPYVRGVSESLRRTLTLLRIRTCFKPHKTIRQMLCKPKDPIPYLQQSEIVYRIPCSKCPASYIGQTGRRLEQRVKEHKRSVAQVNFNSSALAEHAWTLEHEVDWKM